MKKMNKKEIEDIYPSLTIEKKEIGKFLVVYGNAHIPAIFYDFTLCDTFEEAAVCASSKISDEHIRPIIQIVA